MNHQGRDVFVAMTDRLLHLDAPCDAAVIVGGGPAGLSAALVLGRANKRVLVVDDGRPANAVSQGVGGLLAHDRVIGRPTCVAAAGRQLGRTRTSAVRHGASWTSSRRRRGSW